jgi:hypothetical protein
MGAHIVAMVGAEGAPRNPCRCEVGPKEKGPAAIQLRWKWEVPAFKPVNLAGEVTERAVFSCSVDRPVRD